MATPITLSILIPSFVSFIMTLIAVKFVSSYLYESGVFAEDHNKAKPTALPSSGGIAVAFGVLMGVLTYIFASSFSFTSIKGAVNISVLFAVILSILLISMVGFLDDLNVRRKHIMATDLKDFKKGLKQWQKPLLTVIGALPLVAINAGVSTVVVPFFGIINLGIFYPILVLPLAIIFVSNAFNLLGGFDGLQPQMAIAAFAGLFIYSIMYGTFLGAFLSGIVLAALVAFLPFNIYRSRIIPGDSFTYAIGASFVAVMVLGSAESFGLIIFIPWIIEFFLHLRRKFRVSDLGIKQKDGTFRAPYGRHIYSWTHVVMNIKKAKETDVANYLTLLEIGFVMLAFALKVYGFL